MIGDTKKYWESKRVALAVANTAYLVTKLYGGESITIKNPNGTDKDVTIGESQQIVRNSHYMLDSGEKMTLTLPVEFGKGNYIEIWALPKSNGYTLDYFKLLGYRPKTQGSD